MWRQTLTVKLNEKEWLELTCNETRGYSSDARFMLSLAMTYLAISISVIGIVYVISNSINDSVANLLNENQNISVNASNFIKWQINQSAGNLQTVINLGTLSAIIPLGLIFYTIIVVTPKKRRMEKLYFKILRNEIKGCSEEERCNEIYNQYMAIIKGKNIKEERNEMSKIIYTTIFSIVLLAVFGGIYYFFRDLQLIFSGLVAIATIVYAYLTAQLVGVNKDIRDMQKKLMEPNINVDFQHEENDMSMVHMVIENMGKGIARDVKIDISPDMLYIPGKKLSDLEIIKNKHDIPANKRIKFFLTSMLQDTEEKTKEPYKISVHYKNEQGEESHKEFEIDLKMLVGTLYSAHTSLTDIRDFLNSIKDDIHTITNGNKKIMTINYTKEEAKKEKEDEIKRAKEMIEKQKEGIKETQEKERSK